MEQGAGGSVEEQSEFYVCIQELKIWTPYYREKQSTVFLVYIVRLTRYYTNHESSKLVFSKMPSLLLQKLFLEVPMQRKPASLLFMNNRVMTICRAQVGLRLTALQQSRYVNIDLIIRT